MIYFLVGLFVGAAGASTLIILYGKRGLVLLEEIKTDIKILRSQL